MIISLFAYSKQGTRTAVKVIEALKTAKERESCFINAFTLEKHRIEGFFTIPEDKNAFYEKEFHSSDALIFVGAAGIAVRHIAPFIKSKLTDPAVICIDELGKFVIPILSGHIGGANKTALMLSECIGAIPVITTATDINMKFAVDSWAVSQGLLIDNMKLAKEVSAEILERDVKCVSQFDIEGRKPESLIFSKYSPEEKELNPDRLIRPDEAETDCEESIGIFIGWKKAQPFKKTLRLISKNLYVGIGCRKGISEDAVREAVESVFEENKIDIRSVAGAASIDIKSEEAGLLKFAQSKNWEMTFYSANELSAVKEVSSHSDFVKNITGVDNVCERAALMKGSRLIVNKTAVNGVTVAIAEKTGEIKWEN